MLKENKSDLEKCGLTYDQPMKPVANEQAMKGYKIEDYLIFINNRDERKM